MDMIEQRKSKMREFLGRVAGEALGLKDVESVSVRLVDKLSFEGDGYDGEIRLLLLGDRRFGYTFSAMELAYIRDPQEMFDEFEVKFLGAIERDPAQPG